jgi:hypothetical protein
MLRSNVQNPALVPDPSNPDRRFSRSAAEFPYELGAHLPYAPMPELSLFLTGRNLTNHHYTTKGVLGPTPAEPLFVFGGARYTFAVR